MRWFSIAFNWVNRQIFSRLNAACQFFCFFFAIIFPAGQQSNVFSMHDLFTQHWNVAVCSLAIQFHSNYYHFANGTERDKTKQSKRNRKNTTPFQWWNLLTIKAQVNLVDFDSVGWGSSLISVHAMACCSPLPLLPKKAVYADYFPILNITNEVSEMDKSTYFVPQKMNLKKKNPKQNRTKCEEWHSNLKLQLNENSSY